MAHENIPALKKQWVLDATWTDCPKDVRADIEALWRFRELGNDNYMIRMSINDFEELNDQSFEVEHWDEELYREKQIGWHNVPLKIDALITYLKEKGIPEHEEVILHYWW